jgi:hypothetical protein
LERRPEHARYFGVAILNTNASQSVVTIKNGILEHFWTGIVVNYPPGPDLDPVGSLANLTIDNVTFIDDYDGDIFLSQSV